MLLKKLINRCPDKFSNVKISGLSLNSKDIRPGYIFFAKKGSKEMGSDYALEAFNKGAKVIVSENLIRLNKKIILIKVSDLSKCLEHACKVFYSDLPKNIVAVTGTNGKTSVADFFRQIFLINKIPAASIGTLGIKKNFQTKPSSLTSPDIVNLYKELAIMKKNKINNVIIEASSHGLHQGRLNGLNIKCSIFTNFSQDHLDYHKTMKRYFEAKTILFEKLLKKRRKVIVFSDFVKLKELNKICRKKGLKIINEKKLKLDLNKNLSKELIGSFQKKNILQAAIAANICGLKKNILKKSLIKINNVEGRLDLVKTFPNHRKVYVDYAHTPDALNKTLETLGEYYNNLTIVFGCGGDRDISKRSKMAKIAKKHCQKIYVTDDNPRYENANKIRKQIIKNIKGVWFKNIGNRKEAINLAIKNSEPNEVILISGKGHENFQYIKNKSIKLNDSNVVKKIKFKNISDKDHPKIHNLKLLKKLKIKAKKGFLGVSINSKRIKRGNLFLGIKGKNKDGNLFTSEAFKKGANICVVNKNINKSNCHKVKNTKKFLNKLAILKRKVSKAKVIGITGSAGKTSTKNLVGNLMKNYGKTYYSPKSYNNDFGVPLSLSNLETFHDYGVFEIGMNKKGEIKKLSSLVKPHIAIITNIAEAHIENFKNLREIAQAKAEIIENIDSNGILILNKDDNFYNYFLKKSKMYRNMKVISFGKKKGSDIRLISEKKIKGINHLKIELFNEKFSFKTNYSQTSNILSLIAVIYSLKLNFKKIINKIKKIDPLEGRGKIYNIERFKKKFKLIDESYNANPLSMKNAIQNFSNIKKERFNKYLLLSDMLELGKKSTLYHKNLAAVINKTNIDKSFIYGKDIMETFKFIKENKKGNILQSLDDFDPVFSNILKNGDYLLIKGSNATGLNTLTKNLIRGLKNAF
tara:strand:- start:286 stop:3045 length:2760 start_codon:yes stop_codon:yes gene_type:complete